ncbi:MAG: hypothetical protein ACC707_10545 [Thiohalomonadales bacterium]
MFKPQSAIGFLLIILFTLVNSQVFAATVNLNSPQILGGYKLNNGQLKSIKTAVQKAMKGPIDDNLQCGKVRLDCVVRAASEWKFEGAVYREIVINLHTIGDASMTVSKVKGKWPSIKIK